MWTDRYSSLKFKVEGGIVVDLVVVNSPDP